MTLNLSPANRRYGRIPDRHDSRDLTMSEAPVFRLRASQLPPKVDLTEWCGPIKDQGEEGSCTGHAYSSIREFLARKFQNQSPILSPQFLYAEELLLEGTYPEDSGAQSRTGCLILNRYGCCEEASYPYQAGNIQKPSLAQEENAKKWIGGAYHRITNLADILSCLASGYPCSVGFTVYQSFESQQTANSGVMPMPHKGEMILGGHEVFAVGYDQSTETVLIQNSWGASWGIGGRFKMPFDFISNPAYTSDIWLCHLGRPWRK